MAGGGTCHRARHEPRPHHPARHPDSADVRATRYLLPATLPRRDQNESPRGETILASSADAQLAATLLRPGQPLSPLVADLRPDAVLSVDLGATAAPDAAAVGDVLVPAIVRLSDRADIAVSPSVLATARRLAREPWASQLDEPRPGRDDEQPAVRFGDVIATDRVIVERRHAQARGLGIVVPGAAAIAQQVSPEAAFGLVLGIGDDSSIEKSDAWQAYTCAAASEFAVALAAALQPATDAPTLLLPQRELRPDTQLYRVHRARLGPLAAPMPIAFAATAAAALADTVIGWYGSPTTIPQSLVADLRVTRFTLRSPLRLADLTVPSAPRASFGLRSAWRLDQRQMAILLEAGLDGWVSPSRLSVDPRWDRIVLARPGLPLPEAQDQWSVGETLAALEPDDSVTQLLRSVVPQD